MHHFILSKNVPAILYPMLKYCGMQVEKNTKSKYLSDLVAEVCFACMATAAVGKASAGFGRKLFEALRLSEGNRALMIFFLYEWLNTK